MSAKFSFHLESRDRTRDLPHKIIIGRQETETMTHVGLKFLSYLMFYRERIQLETNLHEDSIPYVPDLVQLDYEMRPRLWVECGDCGVGKLDKLAVKVPEAEIWIMKASPSAAEHLLAAMQKEGLRTNRYRLLALNPEMFEEFVRMIKSRNQLLWVGCDFDENTIQFDFNGLWFDSTFEIYQH